MASQINEVEDLPKLLSQSLNYRSDLYDNEKRPLESPVKEVDTPSLTDSQDVEKVRLLEDPIIRSGADVSNYVVDDRDDGDEALTFRSFLLGTLIAGLGASLSQIYVFKPIQVSVSSIFLLLLTYTLGKAWAKFLPSRAFFESKPALSRFAPIAGFINPGHFGIKEHVVSTLIATTAATGSTAVNNFAVQKLFYDAEVNAATAILATFSTACFGYGIVGLLRPLTVYPSEMVYWSNLPTIVTVQTLHWDVASRAMRRLKFFWSFFSIAAIYEIIPAYMFPTLNGVSVFCLASQKASPNTRSVFSYLFGGADANEGLGLLSMSFDWQYITSYYLSLPLIQQANSWVGIALCYLTISAIYYGNVWNAKSFPMLSASIFGDNGKRYNQTAVFGPTFSLNQTAYAQIGPPNLTGSNAWAYMTENWAIGGLIAHCIWFWSGYVKDSFVQARSGTQPDRHWVAMSKYKEVPNWWYLCLLALAFFAGLIVTFVGHTTLPWWGYLTALALGAFVAPFSNLLFARLGNGIATNQLMKMVAGAIHPGKPVANLYFSMWSHDVVSTSINLASDLKMGQYLKIPPRVMLITQMWGTLLGCFINYAVMASVVASQREILLDPTGNNVWSGQSVQSLNSAAITWSLAADLYGRNGPYFWIPMGLILGMIPTTIQYFIFKRWPKIGPIEVDKVVLPVIYSYLGYLSVGVNSTITSSIIVGILSQVWLRRSHPGWYRKFNYLLGGALDGGTQVLIFVLSFAVYGASGKDHPFPAWAGNPANGNVDYCLEQ